MSFEALRNGKFTYNYNSRALMGGLRKTASAPRDSYEMSSLVGMVARDDAFKNVPATTAKVDLDGSSPSFPFPQVFVLSRLLLYCTSTKVYELDASDYSLTEAVAVSAGDGWRVMDFFDYVYASNGAVAVVRSASSGVWSETSDLPVAYAMCNYNGQALVGGVS